MNKPTKKYIGIVAVVLGLVALLIYGTQYSVINFSKDQVYAPTFSSAICSQTGTGTINTYDFSSATDSKLSNGWLIYRCGYGNLNSSGDSHAYTNICTATVRIDKDPTIVTNALEVYLCKNEFNWDVNPDKTTLCLKQRVNTYTGKFATFSSTEDIADINGAYAKDGKYSTYAFKIKDGLLWGKTSGQIRIEAPIYEMIISEGNGYTTLEPTGCSLKKIGILDGIFPSSLVDPKGTNTYNGEKFMAFHSTINWLWAYSPVVGAQVINHNSFGRIYVDRVGYYIPITPLDGVSVALETKRVQNNAIECIPNRLDCDDQAKKITDISKVTCNDFKTLAVGERILQANGQSCVYNCVNNKPTFSSCKVITPSTCSKDGEVYDVTKDDCVKVDASNLPNPNGKSSKFNPLPLFIIGIVFLFAVLIIVIAKKKK